MVWLEPNHLQYKYSNILKISHPSYLSAYEDGIDSLPKRRHMKFRRRGISQNKAYNNIFAFLPLPTSGFLSVFMVLRVNINYFPVHC
jgi:pilus assembly protein TadC